jgi:hypothetical protein
MVELAIISPDQSPTWLRRSFRGGLGELSKSTPDLDERVDMSSIFPSPTGLIMSTPLVFASAL